MANNADTLLVLSDMHHPYAHKDHLAFIKAVARAYKPNRVACVGDEADFSSINMHDHPASGPGASDELHATVKGLKPLYDFFPEMDIGISNHTSLPYRRAEKFGLPSAFLKSYRDFLEAPKGWRWHDRFKINGAWIEHGEGVNGPLGALKKAQCNAGPTIIGHIHAFAGVLYGANAADLYWGMNVGWLGDRERLAFAYGKHFVNKPIVSVGLVVKGTPVVVPMKLNGRGRWTGEL